jgi:arabinose-5-phosphate isomerase
MTANPKHVHRDRLVGEVLRLLEASRIDDLVVIDDARAPLGMIDTQDLARRQVV